MSQIIKAFFFSLSLLLIVRPVLATDRPVEVYFFYGQGCPHCAAEEKLLDFLENKYGDKVKIYRYEVWHNRDNAKFLNEVAQRHHMTVSGVPVTFIGSNHVVGYLDGETTGSQIENLITQCFDGSCVCPAQDLFDQFNCPAPVNAGSGISSNQTSGTVGGNLIFKVLFLGKVDFSHYSLLGLTMVFGLLDGFNPCAMWVLLFLLSILLGMRSVARRWLIGGTFIVISGLSYFVFLSAWLNLFLFIGFIGIVRAIIGIFGLCFGVYATYKFFKDKNSGCETTGTENRQKFFDRIRQSLSGKSLIMALVGIAALAFTVNLVELACSAGFPAVYTSVLSFNHLPAWQYYGYLLLYVLFYVAQPFIIFLVVMLTTKMTAVSTKYARYTNLVGGLLIFILGLILIIKPELLMFG